jgi:hypothetical protein
MSTTTLTTTTATESTKRTAMDLMVTTFSLVIAMAGFFHEEVTFLMVGA